MKRASDDYKDIMEKCKYEIERVGPSLTIHCHFDDGTHHKIDIAQGCDQAMIVLIDRERINTTGMTEWETVEIKKCFSAA